jgi:putative nucleotidyltransferase with HDIG domain
VTTENRDPYTAGHQRRVADLAFHIGRELGLPEEQVQGLKLAGLIHDIGKISIPLEILNKPGKLSEAEFTLIQGHSQVGYDILKDIDFGWPIAKIILQHHERVNGSGYPGRIGNGDILLESKIISVADVVEAMASDRPYRPALGIDAALAEVNQKKGQLYDSQIVDICNKLFREKGYKFEI